MSHLTDDFDIVLQVKGDIIQQVLQAQHRAGIIRHSYALPRDDQRLELLVNSPQLVLITAPQADNLARARLASRVHYHRRNLYGMGDVGRGAVADATVRFSLQMSTGDPVPLLNGAELIVDVRETVRNDISVRGATAAMGHEVKDVLLELIENYGGGRFTIPPLGSGNRRIGSVAFRFLSSGAGNAILIIGMNVGDVVKGNKAGLQQSFVQQDWAIAASGDYLLLEIRDSLRSQLGNSLPPPNGNAPVLISDREVCSLPGPFGICLDHSRQRVFIDSLDVALRPGAIVFTGQLRVTTSAFYIPDISSTFTVPVSLSIGPDQGLQISIGQIEVDVQGVLADIANLISGGAIENIIRNGVQNALQTSLQQEQISELFSADLLRQVAALSTTANLEILPVANSVEIRSEAVIIHGQVTVLNRSANPRAAFTPIRPDDSLTRRIFHAGGSWAPGGRITQYHWDFGDGQSTTASGNTARFISEHEYAIGSYNVCLNVTDDLGRSTTNCVRVETARLSLRHTPVQYQGRPLSPWRACQTADPIDVEFSVFDERTPVSDVLVRVEGQDYELEGYTNQYGKVAFQIDITNDHAWPDGLGRGYMIIRASKDGYLPAAFERLVFIDCALLSEVVDLGSLRIRDLSERLQKIAELLDSLNPPVPPEPSPPIEDGLGPFDGWLADVALGLDVLTKLVLLLRQDSEALPVMRLLGLQATEERPSSALKERLEESFSNIERTLDALDEESRRLQERYPDKI